MIDPDEAGKRNRVPIALPKFLHTAERDALHFLATRPRRASIFCTPIRFASSLQQELFAQR